VIERAPWLPCPRCGSMAPDCLENPVDEQVWEVLLDRSKQTRESQRHAAMYAANREAWAA
jgi:hypothetical protein